MALKYSFKLIFHKCLFDFMINTSPQASHSVNGREKCLKCDNFTSLIIKCQHGPVFWELYSCTGVSHGVHSNLHVNIFIFFVHFFC